MFEKEAKKYAEAFLYKGVAEASFIKGAKFGYNKGKDEAKEIIRKLLSSCFGYTSKTVNYEVKAKAEAFLKE